MLQMCISLTKSVPKELFYSISLVLVKAFKCILQVIRKFHIQIFRCFKDADLEKVEGIIYIFENYKLGDRCCKSK